MGPPSAVAAAAAAAASASRSGGSATNIRKWTSLAASLSLSLPMFRRGAAATSASASAATATAAGLTAGLIATRKSSAMVFRLRPRTCGVGVGPAVFATSSPPEAAFAAFLPPSFVPRRVVGASRRFASPPLPDRSLSSLADPDPRSGGGGVGVYDDDCRSVDSHDASGNGDGDETPSPLLGLTEGKPNGFYVFRRQSVPAAGLSLDSLASSSTGGGIPPETFRRLELTDANATLPVALMAMFPDEFDSQSKARRECRRGTVLIHRGPLIASPTAGATAAAGDDGDDDEGEDGAAFDRERLFVGRVGDRVYPRDVIALQTRMTGTKYASSTPETSSDYDLPPPFHLPVVYEDDHFAIVNKPEGVVVFSHRGSNGVHGRNTVKAALPYALRPPTTGTVSVLRRPRPVHRLDRPTSGLLLAAKTKPAMVELSKKFRDRTIKKTYTAIINGAVDEPEETSITPDEARELGVCVDGPNRASDGDGGGAPHRVIAWQVIDEELDNQTATTVWRTVARRSPFENAWDDAVTLVELKPQTGRYHQLRRHMAWVVNRPILGDKVYDGGGQAVGLRDDGLYLCSNKVTLEHPYFNTERGREEWDALDEGDERKYAGGMVRLSEDNNVLVHVEIDLPSKFDMFQ